MIILWGSTQYAVRVLLDTGCSVPLISARITQQLDIRRIRRSRAAPLLNCSGEEVKGAGMEYTDPLLLQHRKHYSREVFEVAPLELEVDLFLPFRWISKHPPQGAWDSEELRFSSPNCLESCTRYKTVEFSVSLDETVTLDPEARIIGYISAINKKDPRDQVPEEFRGYLDIMSQETAEELPAHQPYDCKIDLKEVETAPWGPIYPLSENELQTLREWIKEMLRTGKIRRSTSPDGSPILFVPKPNGRGLWLCVDYRALNQITIANRYPLPLMQELQDRVQGARWFTKLDLKNGFNLIRIREGDEWKTAFRTRYGLYEFQVMPFGLTNAPSTFQDIMNNVFSDMIDLGLLVYMDDFLIYAKTKEEHDRRVKEVLARLQENRLAVSPDKCVWKTQEVEFLEAVLEWKTPASLTEVQSFLGFTNFYRRFIQDYSRVARPLMELTKGNKKEWEWNPQVEEVFQELKRRFTTAPILAHFDATRPVIIKTDGSDFAIGAILSQRDDRGRLHPVAFHSQKFQPVEINYEIHDKELLAIVDTIKHWRQYCEGVTNQVQVFSDHQNLEFFTTTMILNRRQARWAQELAGIDFRIYYRPGNRKGKPDALSRHSEYHPEKGGSENHPITTVLQKDNFAEPDRRERTFICSSARLASLPPWEWLKEFAEAVPEAGKKDNEYQGAWKELEAVLGNAALNDRKVKEAAAHPCEVRQRDQKVRTDDVHEIKDGLLYRKGMLWIPEDGTLKKLILESEHNTKISGHMGHDKTIQLIQRNFWWPKMNERIVDFVRSCPECQENKAAQYQPYGLLSPLELPYAPWQSIAMDFIMELPLSEGCDQLWVVIDRFAKIAHFLPLEKEKKTAADLAVTFAREVWKHHGLPTDIVWDRDSRFTSETWQEFLRLSGICPRMSTAFHPQTDGQTERLNQTIEAYLQAFVSHEQDNWVDLLPMAEFAYNISITMGNGMSPFYANYGVHPVSSDPAASGPLNPASKLYAHWMHAIHKASAERLEVAHKRMRRYRDPQHTEAPKYQIGDLVMLNGLNIKTRRPFRKLDHKNHGPFQVEKIVLPLTVRLMLPRKWKIHNVFPVSLLEPYRTSEHREPPDPSKILREADDIKQSEEYDVDEVLGSTKKGHHILNLVKWLDYRDQKDLTEEPYDNFSVGGREKRREFHQWNPDAPRDYRLTKG